MEPNELIYILSDSRSGSTALTMQLGLHKGIFAAGEVHQYPYYEKCLKKGKSHCTCGMPFYDCSFWSEVREYLIESYGEIPNTRYPKSKSYLKQIMPLLRLYRKKRTLEEVKLSENIQRFFNAVSAVSCANCIVDSSKWAEHAMLYTATPELKERLVVLYLIRCPLECVLSKKKRAAGSLLLGCLSWLSTNAKCLVAFSAIPKENRLFVRYDQLSDPDAREFQKIYQFLNRYEQESEKAKEMHNLGGSPGRARGCSYRWKNPTEMKITTKKIKHLLIQAFLTPFYLMFCKVGDLLSCKI